MYTGTYWPKDGLVVNGLQSVGWTKGDKTAFRQRAAYCEGPSYCVRLLVFSYEDCL